MKNSYFIAEGSATARASRRPRTARGNARRPLDFRGPDVVRAHERPRETMPEPISPLDRLIVALDMASPDEAERWIARIGDAARFYNDRLPARLCRRTRPRRAAGPRRPQGLPRPEAARHRQHRRGGRAVGGRARRDVPHRPRLPADDAGGGARARRGAGLGPEDPRRHGADLYDDDDAREAGYALGVADLVAVRAAAAREIGIDGIVCAATEAATVRDRVGPTG